MKYTYAYKTSDGTRHEEMIEAESRESAFAALRAKGIKAIKVVAADGSKANGEIRGIRKRVLAASVVSAALLAGLGVFFLSQGTKREARGTTTEARPLARQEIGGNRGRVEKAQAEAFKNPAEAFLARFAEPGRKFSAPECDWPKKADFEAVLDRPILVASDEFTESIDLKQIVVGMKKEMSAYLKGGGLVSGYIRELINRQQMECGFRANAQKKLDELLAPPSYTQTDKVASVELDKQLRSAYDFWLKANAQLQAMGIYTLPLPPRLYKYQSSIGFED